MTPLTSLTDVRSYSLDSSGHPAPVTIDSFSWACAGAFTAGALVVALCKWAVTAKSSRITNVVQSRRRGSQWAMAATGPGTRPELLPLHCMVVCTEATPLQTRA